MEREGQNTYRLMVVEKEIKQAINEWRNRQINTILTSVVNKEGNSLDCLVV